MRPRCIASLRLTIVLYDYPYVYCEVLIMAEYEKSQLGLKVPNWDYFVRVVFICLWYR